MSLADGDRRNASVTVDLFLLSGQFPGTTHHPYGTCPSALAFAGYLLGRTERLRIGTAACLLSNRHPVALAEEAALVHEISGGRLDLGVARGGPWVDLEVFGTGLDRYRSGFAESLDLLLSWLSGAERVGADGRLFRFPPVTVVPRPREPVPVWVAATSPSTVDLAAERGLPVLLGIHATVGEKRDLLDRYPQRGLAHASAHVAYVADSRDEAVAALRAAMPGWLATTREYVRIDGSAAPVRDPHAYLDHLLEIHPVGPPALCVDRLAGAVAATGARRLLLMVEGAGDRALTLANIDRLGTEVVPALAAALENGNGFH